MIHPRALLYHSVYGRIPSALDGLIHNVDPETFRRQIAWCKERFEFVSADDLFSSPRAGSLCITFDDANESVLSIALPILETLKIPATIFINGVSLLGRPLWRDKIRWLIKNRMVRDFLEGNPSYSALLPSDSERFFAATKSPRVNSARLDRDLDAFLAAKGISRPLPGDSASTRRSRLRRSWIQPLRADEPYPRGTGKGNRCQSGPNPLPGREALAHFRRALRPCVPS